MKKASFSQRGIALSIWKSVAFGSAVALTLVAFPAFAADALRVQGSAAATAVVRSAMPAFKAECGIELKVITDGGSTQAIASVGTGSVDVAVTTRALTAEDRANFPSRRFEERQIASQVFALVVAPDVWSAGVQSLSREQMTKIFEGGIKNWKEVGGADRPIKFYKPQPGPGAWEEFATWLYGEVRNAPLGKFDIVGRSEDARDSVEFNAGSMSIVPPKYANGKTVFALGIKLPDGTITRPVATDVDSGIYPMTRPIFLISGDTLTGSIRRLFDFFQTSRGQEGVEKAGLMPVSAKP